MRRWIALGGVAVLLIAVAWALWFSPLLSVRSLQVAGATDDLAGQVRAKADGAVGRPLMRTDPAAVQQRIEHLPAVRSVQVSRDLPSTLRVHVRPRTPVVVVDRGGERRLVDATGKAYAAASGDGGRGLPVVRPGKEGVSGQDVADVARVMGAIPGKDRDQVKGIRLSRIGHLSFTIDGLKVLWGDTSQSRAKAKALTTMRPVAAKQGRDRVDLSTPDRPVLTR